MLDPVPSELSAAGAKRGFEKFTPKKFPLPTIYLGPAGLGLLLQNIATVRNCHDMVMVLALVFVLVLLLVLVLVMVKCL